MALKLAWAQLSLCLFLSTPKKPACGLLILILVFLGGPMQDANRRKNQRAQRQPKGYIRLQGTVVISHRPFAAMIPITGKNKRGPIAATILLITWRQFVEWASSNDINAAWSLMIRTADCDLYLGLPLCGSSSLRMAPWAWAERDLLCDDLE